MLEPESHPSQRVVLDPSAERKTVAASKSQIAALQSQVVAMKDEVRDQVEAVDKIAQIDGRVAAVRGTLLKPFGLLEDRATRGHRDVRNSLREAVGQLRKRMASVFQKEAMRMQVRVDQAVHKAVRDVATHSQGVQEEIRSKLSEAVRTVAPVVGGACEEPAAEVVVRPEDVCGSDEPMAQIGLPARAVELTEEEC